jgi:hypothetical protein
VIVAFNAIVTTIDAPIDKRMQLLIVERCISFWIRGSGLLKNIWR